MAKQLLTKQLNITLDAASVNEAFINFIEANVRKHPGASSLRLTILEPKENLKVSLYTFDKRFLMNEEMAEFLNHNPELGVSVGLS